MIQALVWSLGDKHSNYFPPKEAKDFSEVLRGDFEGIGAVIDEHPLGIILRRVFSTSPAEKAGLLAGDILTHVDTTNIVGLSSEEAVMKIRWPKGSQAILTYLHGDTHEEKKVTVTRDTIVLPSTQEKMLSGSVGYIEVAFFGDHTKEEFEKSLQNITASWAKSLILDFRNNGWGYLESSVDLLSYFLPDKSLAVMTRENDVKNNESFSTTKNPLTNENIPIVIIINNLSASATEIFAWALQDYTRAILVWEKSYGKWSVQTPFIMHDGSILKVTIGRWYTPKDKSIDKNGITPDVRIPLYESDYQKRYDRQLEWAKTVLETLEKNAGNRVNTLEAVRKIDFTTQK